MRGRKAETIKNLRQFDFDELSKTQGNPRERRRYLVGPEKSKNILQKQSKDCF